LFIDLFDIYFIFWYIYNTTGMPCLKKVAGCCANCDWTFVFREMKEVFHVAGTLLHFKQDCTQCS